MDDLTHEEGVILEVVVKGLRLGDKPAGTCPLEVGWAQLAKEVRGGRLGLESGDGVEVGGLWIGGGGVAERG